VPTNKRQQIVTAIDTALKTILVANGYETNMGAAVTWWAPAPIEAVTLPAVNAKDTDVTIWRSIGEHGHDLTVSVDIFLQPAYATADVEMRKAIADVTKCVGVDVSWGGLAQDTGLITENGLHIEQLEYCFAAVGLSFVVEFTTNAWDPYA
jgi:hypothetical protein